jgi:hypothetical protein
MTERTPYEVLVEKAARALWRHREGDYAPNATWEGIAGYSRCKYLSEAAAAVDAVLGELGEVTGEMQEAGWEMRAKLGRLERKAVVAPIYRAMLAAKLGREG